MWKACCQGVSKGRMSHLKHLDQLSLPLLSQLKIPSISSDSLSHSFCSPPLLQYQAWWKDRYGKNSFNDDEEVENLLTKKSNNSSSNTIRSSIAPTLGFWNEIASVSFIFPEVKQPAEDCGVSSRTIKPAEARPENCCRCRSCWETFFIDMIRRLSSWLSSHVMGGGFLCHYLCPLRHVMSLPLTVKTTCKGSQAWHQGNMYIQSTVWTHI